MRIQSKHIFLTAAFVLLSAIGIRAAVTVDGISYNLDSADNTAAVAPATYSGEVTVPATIISDGTTYTVTSVAESAFANASVKTVKLPNTVRTIGESAFANCQSLESIELGNSVETIGQTAFFYCKQLKGFTVPPTLRTIDGMTFYECIGLTRVDISDIGAWCRMEFKDKYANPLLIARNLYLNGELMTDVVVPSDVKAIGNYVFQNCECLENITFPKGLESIGDNCFQNCIKLKAVDIPNSVKTVGRNLFASCI